MRTVAVGARLYGGAQQPVPATVPAAKRKVEQPGFIPVDTGMDLAFADDIDQAEKKPIGFLCDIRQQAYLRPPRYPPRMIGYERAAADGLRREMQRAAAADIPKLFLTLAAGSRSR